MCFLVYNINTQKITKIIKISTFNYFILLFFRFIGVQTAESISRVDPEFYRPNKRGENRQNARENKI